MDGGDAPFTAYLTLSRREISVPSNKTLLEAIREAGVRLSSTCDEGRCSTCIVRVVAGAIDHRDRVFNAKERAKGDRILPCVSRAKPGERLILEL